MATFRDQIKGYVDNHWAVPCGDGIVWVYYAAIDTRSQAAKHKQATKKDWSAAFLQYADPTFGALEGLYLIPPAEVAKVKTGQMDASSYPERKMIASWFDLADKNSLNPEVTSQKPEYHGLNDCAHFVTQSLAAGGIHVETAGVPTLFNSLRGLADTKTLAKTTSAGLAEAILKAGLMKVGDVIIYSKGGNHHHSVVYMGNAQIAMHTWANHPSHPTLKGDWKASASEDHPLVTLIHFGRDDPPINPSSAILGWWRVAWRGTDYFYFFDKAGRVGYTKKPPTRFDRPLSNPEGRGYWFFQTSQISICWSATGSLEVLKGSTGAGGTHLEGTWNGSERLVGDKIS